jgi:hypothetical protein
MIFSKCCTHVIVLNGENDKAMRIFLQQWFTGEQALFFQELVRGLVGQHVGFVGRFVRFVIGAVVVKGRITGRRLGRSYQGSHSGFDSFILGHGFGSRQGGELLFERGKNRHGG